MATLADEITALESAIRRGVRSVTYDGQTVTYRSLAEMRSILSEMRREAGVTSRPADGGRFYPTYSKGV